MTSADMQKLADSLGIYLAIWYSIKGDLDDPGPSIEEWWVGVRTPNGNKYLTEVFGRSEEAVIEELVRIVYSWTARSYSDFDKEYTGLKHTLETLMKLAS